MYSLPFRSRERCCWSDPAWSAWQSNVSSSSIPAIAILTFRRTANNAGGRLSLPPRLRHLRRRKTKPRAAILFSGPDDFVRIIVQGGFLMFSQVFVNCVSLLALAALSFIPVTNREKVPALVQSSVSTAFVPTTMLPAAGFDAPRGGSRSQAALRAKVAKNYGELPLSFQPNRGQTNSKARFLSQNAQYTLFLTDDEAIFSFADQLASTPGKVGLRPISRELRGTVPLRPGTVLRMKLRRANPAAKVSGEGKLSSKSNYFIGNDPKKWMQGVTNYAKVKYQDVYSGIDLVFYGNQRHLEYDFVVAPGADSQSIRMQFEGVSQLRVTSDGDLVATTS